MKTLLEAMQSRLPDAELPKPAAKKKAAKKAAE
jgi:hypothetical protein